MKFNLEEREIEIIQIALTNYIIQSNKKKEISRYIEDAKILLDNINFYKRQEK